MMRLVKPPADRAPPNAKPIKTVQGKTLLLGLLGSLLVAVGLVFYFGVTGGSTHVPLAKPGVGFTTDPAAHATESATTGTGATATLDASITKTIVDRAVRDDLRRRILAGWAATGEPEVAAAAKQGRFVPAPSADGGGMEPAYIRQVVREEFFPMAKACYSELLSRKDAGGRIEMSFTIVADEKLGGIVEDVTVVGDGGVADEKMSTCMRESMTTLAFRPPAHGGTVTVRYPIEFSNDGRDD